MKKFSYVIMALTLVQVSCTNNKSGEEVRSMNEPDRPMNILEDLVVNKGDIEAYEELETAYLDYQHGEFYKFAKIMADKYDYPRAYYDVYIQILKPTNRPGTVISLDSCTQEEKIEAIQYLSSAYKKGFEPARDELKELKKEGHIK